jgi:uncharacterized protein DUF6519
MQGDFSRWTFDPREDYRSVLLQQGRVLLDADWNEQTELTRYHDETRTRDVVGRAGGPADGAGFGIVDATGAPPVETPWADLRITPGRYYVDGILCAARLPDGDTGPGIPLADQPYLAAIGPDPGLPEPATDGRYALYLDVWTHHVTVDEEPSLRESALGGPDTTTRARTVWQVRAVEISPDQECSDLHDPGWLAVTPGTMTPSLKEAPPAADPCQITTAGGYTRLENQLYRVQIHDTGAGTARYLWSRENGSVVAGLVGIDATTAPGMDAELTVDRVGRDDELSIREGDTVEVTSTDLQLRGQPGFLATAGAPDGLVLPVSWSGGGPASVDALGWAPIVRRWEGDARLADATPDDLEDGIVVSFDGGPFRTGDHWLVPARTVRLAYGLTALSGTLDWPTDAAGNPVPTTPLGPLHHVTPLAVLTRSAVGWTRVSDCRRFVPSLSDLIAIDLVGGDGQEAPPGDPLPEPIRFAVRNGGLPVAGAVIRVIAQGGTVDDGTANGGTIATATGPDGVAALRWTLDPAGAPTQTLMAQRVDDHGAGVDVEVIVTGRLSQATPGGRTPGIHVIKATITMPTGAVRPFDNDDVISTQELAEGIRITLDGAALPESLSVSVNGNIRFKPVVRVVLDLPWPLPDELPTWPNPPPVGFRPIELDAEYDTDHDQIVWKPGGNARRWLLEELGPGLQQAEWDRPLVGRFVIDGWGIVAEQDPKLHLNGHGNTVIDANGHTQLILPTDDEVTGGQFIQWFFLEWRPVS